MARLTISEIDGGPSGSWWELSENVIDYPVSQWHDDRQLAADILELAREGHEIVVRSQEWWQANSCPECGAPAGECECGSPQCDVCGAFQLGTPDMEWNGETGMHVDCEGAA